MRVERATPVEYRVAPPRRVRQPRSPSAVLVIGFGIVIAIGAVLLALPISSAAGTWTSPLDALFTSTSAVCVTGLAIFDTGTYWSWFGQLVLLVLMQLGGFGFMTGSTLLLFLLVGRRTALRDRILAQASTGVPELGSVRSVIARVAAFTLIAEVAGAVILTLSFIVGGSAADPAQGLWWGVFHSVSAFNNGGIDLFGDYQSLAGFVGDPVILGTLGVLILLGSLGFAIVGDIAAKRRWARLALETRVVVLTTVAILAVGTVTIGVFEWSNPETLGAMPVASRPFNALFEATTLRTAGFSTVPTGDLRDPTLFIVMAMMFIGGASGSTAGGIKVNTFSVLLIAIVSTVRGLPDAEALGRRLPNDVIFRALSVALLSIAFVFVVAFGLELTTPATISFIAVVFESISAFGTVGASTGITPELPAPARALLIPAMFAGRLGPLTLVLALAARARRRPARPAVETMRIG
ncbi:MAG TPA: potassium transporter TrkG [Candidatus Saccharimonadales bacterium]|nr:potassium transporter TrkG [Candidatus Saccharimonadales bacterium]